MHEQVVFRLMKQLRSCEQQTVCNHTSDILCATVEVKLIKHWLDALCQVRQRDNPVIRIPISRSLY
jgi:hypothetical protein